MVRIDLSTFQPEEQEEVRKKVLSLAWEKFITPGHPEYLTVAWCREEPIEKVFPDLVPYMTHI